MRIRTLTLLAVPLAVMAATPLAAHAAGIPFFGPIIEDSWNSCALGWGAVILVVNNIIRLGITLAITIVAPIMIAWSGFLITVNPVNPGGREQAKKILTNTIVGIVLALASWMIVAAVLTTLTGNSVNFYVAMITGNGGDVCAQQSGALGSLNQSNGQTSGFVTGYNSSGGAAGGQCSAGNNACSVSALQGAGLNGTQANVMSCIAITESSGNPSTPPYNQSHPGSDSTACGTFQITKTTWNSVAPSGSCSDWASSCQNAACNLQVAATLVNQSGYSSWTCAGCNNKANGCIQQYGGG